MLSSRSQNSIRAIAALARGGTAMQGAAALAGSSSVPLPYLLKLMGAMARRGLIEAKRGRGGGYRLARDPARIRLDEVVGTFQDGSDDPGCILVSRPCGDAGGCGARFAWKPVQAAYLRFLERTTVADIAGEPCGRRVAPEVRPCRGRRPTG